MASELMTFEARGHYELMCNIAIGNHSPQADCK